jgi:hypothetical protein
MPEDLVADDQEGAGHHLDVTHRLPREVAPDERPQRSEDGSRPDHLADGSGPESEGGIELEPGVGDRRDFRPPGREELVPLLHIALVHEHHPGKVGLPHGEPPEILDGLPAEDSPEMAQKNEKGRVVAQDLPERFASEIPSGDRSVELI